MEFSGRPCTSLEAAWCLLLTSEAITEKQLGFNFWTKELSVSNAPRKGGHQNAANATQKASIVRY
jgi:hypothetical protein